MQMTMRFFLGASLLASAFGPPVAAAGGRWAQYAGIGEIAGMADAGGQVWLGASGGLIRVDKVSAETTYFNQVNSSLMDLGIRNVASDGKGSVAAVSRSGALSVFDGHSWSNPGIATPLRGQFCFDALWDAAGSFWVLAADPVSRLPSLFRRRNSQWNRFYLDGVDVLSGDGYGGYAYSAYLPGGFGQPGLQADRDGRVWASVLNRLKAKVFRIDPDGSMDTVAAPEKSGYYQLVVPDTGAPVWLGRLGMFRIRPDGFDTLKLPGAGYSGSLFFNPRNRFARASDGSELWSLVPDKINRLRSGVWDELPVPAGQSSFSPVLLLQAAGWIGPGIPAHAISVSTGTRCGTLEGDSLALTSVAKSPFLAKWNLAFFPGASGDSTMLLGSNYGVEAFDPGSGKFAPLYSAPAIPPREATSLFADRAGRVWASSRGVLGLLRPGGMDTLPPPDGAWYGTTANPYAMNSFMAEDPSGTLWFADSSRLFSSRKGSADTRTWSRHPLPAPWSRQARISAMARHKDGSIWIAAIVNSDSASQGIAARFDGKTWTVHASLPNDAFPSWSILDLRCDSAGNVWILCSGGLLQWNGTTWIRHAWSSSSLLGKGIHAMAVDGKGVLWAATSPPEAAILRWEESWQSVADATPKMGTSTVGSMAFDAEGKLWMVTNLSGVLVLDPGEATVSGKPRPRPAGQDRSAWSRPSDGSWRIVLPGAPEGGPGFPPGYSARAFDIRGKAIPLRNDLP